MNDVVIYFDDWFDSKSCAFLYYKYLINQKKKDVDVVEIIHKIDTADSSDITYINFDGNADILNEVNGKTILLCGYKGDPIILKKIIEASSRITIIDNNQENKEIYDIIKPKEKMILKYDNKNTLSYIIWEYLFKEYSMPTYVKYLDKKFRGTANEKINNFRLGLGIDFFNDHIILSEEKFYVNFSRWDKLFDMKYIKELIDHGGAYKILIKYLVLDKVNDLEIKYFPSEKIYKKFNNIFMGQNQFKVIAYNWIDDFLMKYVKMFFSNQHKNCDLILLWNYSLKTKLYRVIIFNLADNNINLQKIALLFDKQPNPIFDNDIEFYIKKDDYDIDELFSS